MSLFVIFLLHFLLPVSSLKLIDYSKVKVLTIPGGAHSAFGFSQFLQKGNPPVVIVGAPKFTQLVNNETLATGAIFYCNLLNSDCERHNNVTLGPENDFVAGTLDENGYFLGTVIEGDDDRILTCAPRFIQSDRLQTDITMKGQCFVITDSQLLQGRPLQKEKNRRNGGINAQYGEVGFDVAYNPEGRGELIFGAPGKLEWIGSLVVTSLELKNPTISAPKKKPTDTYFGYAVSWGIFVQNRDTWYVSGAPRGNDLKGQVLLFKHEAGGGIKVKKDFMGPHLGSYFGATLLVIRHHSFDQDRENRTDDILIGAPILSSRASWDEGAVYFYKNEGDGSFYPPLVLRGRQSGSRFGSVIADLLDLDLDTFRDVAISAPYEDEGVGAVYIFFGTPDGFSDHKFHKITPKSFSLHPKEPIAGFGIGISRATDLDGNLHGEFTVGAYQTGQVFFFSTYTLADLEGTIRPSTDTLFPTSSNFSVDYCVNFRTRNKENTTEDLLVQLLVTDERIIGGGTNITRNVTAAHNMEPKCFRDTILIQCDHVVTDPVKVELWAQILRVHSSMETLANVSLLVSRGCGDDNICRTILTLKVLSGYEDQKILVGIRNELKLEVLVQNFGDIAYQPELIVTLPDLSGKHVVRGCASDRRGYSCSLGTKIGPSMTRDKHLIFDIDLSRHESSVFTIKIEVKSLGTNINSFGKNQVVLEIPLTFQSNPLLDSKPWPSIIQWDKIREDENITHAFLISNAGPSPMVNWTLTFYLPQIKQVFDIYSEDLLGGLLSECSIRRPDLPKVRTLNKWNNSIDCSNDQRESCVEITCGADILSKSDLVALVSVKININLRRLSQFLEDINVVTLVSSALLNNGTTTIESSCSTLLLGLAQKRIVPLWICLAAAMSGTTLLILLVLLLHKCHFFKRDFKDKLEVERAKNLKRKQSQRKDQAGRKSKRKNKRGEDEWTRMSMYGPVFIP